MTNEYGKIVPIHQINISHNFSSPQELIKWFQEEKKPENVRLRFGRDTDAFKYFPDDYYEKLERDWKYEPTRKAVPLDLLQIKDDLYEIVDGWHRLALSYFHKIEFIYADVERV